MTMSMMMMMMMIIAQKIDSKMQTGMVAIPSVALVDACPGGSGLKLPTLFMHHDYLSSFVLLIP